MSDEISIRRFTWLLDHHGYAYVDEHRLEHAITVRGDKRPDFFVNTGRNVRFLPKSTDLTNRPHWTCQSVPPGQFSSAIYRNALTPV